MSDPIEMAPVIGPAGSAWMLELFNKASSQNPLYAGYGGLTGLSTFGGDLVGGAVKGYHHIYDGVDYVFNRNPYQTGRMSPQQDYMVRLRASASAGVMADVVKTSDLSIVTYLSGNGLAEPTDAAAVWSKDAKLLAILNNGNGFKIYNCPDFTLFSDGLLPSSGKSIDFGGDYFICASSSTIRVYLIGAGGLTQVRSHTSSNIQRVALSPTGEFYAVGYASSVAIYRVDTGATLTTISIPATLNTLAFSPDGEYLYAGSSSGVSAWRRAPNFTDSTTPLDLISTPIKEAYFTSDGRHFVVTYGSATFVYDWLSKTTITLGVSSFSGNTSQGALLGKFGVAVSNLNGPPVRDPDGNPVSNVRVHRFRRASIGYPTPMLMSSAAVITNSEGRYEIIGVSRTVDSFVVFQGANDNENSIILDRVKAK